jgi:hypothetical protein
MGPQQTLDTTGTLDLPSGVTSLSQPLFLDSGAWVRGLPGNTLDLTTSGVGPVVGWPRGGVVTANFPTSTSYRTQAGGVYSYLRSSGSYWDLGYPGYDWPSVTKIVVSFSAVLNSPSSWAGLTLCGIQGLEASIGFGPTPSPWILWWNGTALTFTIRTLDGVIHHFTIAASATNTALAVVVTCNLAAGTVTATVGGVSAAITGTLPANSQPCRNELWPFSAGRLDQGCYSSGYWGDNGNADMTIALVAVTLSVAGHTDLTLTTAAGQGGNLLPYVGATSILPILMANASLANVPAVLFAPVRGIPAPTTGCRIQDVNLSTYTGAGGGPNPQILIGAVQGAIDIQGCSFAGGTRGIAMSDLAVAYMTWIDRCRFIFHDDCDLFLKRGVNVSVRDVTSSAARRRFAVLIGVNGTLENVFVAPPGGGVPQEVVIEQRGGVVDYTLLVADYEGGSLPDSVTRITPESWDSPNFPTTATFSRTVSNSVPLYRVRPRAAGYTGPLRIQVDPGDPAYTAGLTDSSLAGSGAVIPDLPGQVSSLGSQVAAVTGRVTVTAQQGGPSVSNPVLLYKTSAGGTSDGAVFHLTPGESVTVSFAPTGGPFNITGQTLRFRVFSHDRSRTLIDLAAAGVTITDPANGLVGVPLTPAQTSLLSQMAAYPFQLEQTLPGQSLMLSGTLQTSKARL